MKNLARLALAATLLAAAPTVLPAQGGARTIVDDPAALQRLRRNSGITLQWIDFGRVPRGHVRVTERNGVVHLSGAQRGNGGELVLEGDVVSIGPRSFRLAGTITIRNTPDRGRICVREGEFEFRVTQNRRYWRLQQMTVCDGLTDYVDIYF